jgi:predicted metal-dependent enzyme (double-stranded beta helix superfamily)
MTDEFICDTLKVKQFVHAVQDIIASTSSIPARLATIRPLFSQLMGDPYWLPNEYRLTYEQGGMGKGIANWLLYRDIEGTLSLSALVLPHEAATPVHDHLAWGLVGLYVGEQVEEIYQPAALVHADDHYSDLKLAEEKHLAVGSFYELIPPTGDIHRVITTSQEPSISLHLLGNDVGCILRHRFEPDTGAVAPFRSGYTNVDCQKPETRPSRKIYNK